MKNNRLAKHWWRFFLAVFPLMILWALSNPMFAAPDEPFHMARAQAAVQGQFGKIIETDGLPMGAVSCLAFKAEVTADCMDLTWGESPTTVEAIADNYPPLFHVLAGIPTFFFHGLFGAYLMRVWLAFICASLLGSAASLLYRRFGSSYVLVGWGFSVMPAVLFLSGSVNPSGVATSLAVLIWALVLSGREQFGKRFEKNYEVILGVVAVVFLLVRRDSILWLALISLCLVVAKIGASKRKEGHWVKGGALVGVLGFVTYFSMKVWLSPIYASWLSVDFQDSSEWKDGLSNTYLYLSQIIGWFGWMDTPIPEQGRVLAAVVLLPFVFLGVATARRQVQAAILLTAGLTVLLPILIAEVQYPYFMGRYILPLAVGVPLLSGVAIARREAELGKFLRHRLPLYFLSGWGCVHFYAFATNVRRNAVGFSGWWGHLGEADWRPPLLGNFTTLAFFAMMVAFSGALLYPLTKAEKAVSEKLGGGCDQ